MFVLVFLALGAAPAGASTVFVNGSSVEIAAAPGEANGVTVSLAGLGVRVRDAAGVVAGSGCVPEAPGDSRVVRCDIARVTALTVRLGDRSDVFDARGLNVPASIDGGSGNDRIVATGAADALDGRLGDDVLIGGDGADRFRARDGDHDIVFCGRGGDRLAVDAIDFISGSCELRRRASAAEATLLSTSYRSFNGRPTPGLVGTPFPGHGAINVGCPVDGPRRCRGSVTITRGRKPLAADRFSIWRGTVGSAEPVATRYGRRLRQGVPVRVTFVLRTTDRTGKPVVRKRRGTYEDVYLPPRRPRAAP